VRRGSIAVVVGLLIGLFIGAFRGSSVIAGELLTPREPSPGPTFEVELVGAGRIVLPRNDLTEKKGVWGVTNGADAYGQMAGVISQDAETVERSFRTLEGRFIAGEMVSIDPYAEGLDPMSSFAIEFENVRIPGNLGVNPAWFVPGSADTWVIIVHGEGLDERRQALRVLPTYVDAGLPVLIITYRNDGAAPDDGGFYRWGLSEWQDIDAAMTYAGAPGRNARSFVLHGFGMGANIVAMHLHESDTASDVIGAVLDSVVVDLGAVVDGIADERGIPAIVNAAAKAVARVRFGLEWAELDQQARAAQFDTPLLVLHASEDDLSPITSVEEFVSAVRGPVTYERFDGADRVELWNQDPERYNDAVLRFLIGVEATVEG
jgi:hypothetical protein